MVVLALAPVPLQKTSVSSGGVSPVAAWPKRICIQSATSGGSAPSTAVQSGQVASGS